MKYKLLERTRILLFCIILIACIFLVKLFYVQVLNGNIYAAEADRQYATPVEQIFDRGNIFFTRKDGTPVSAAMQISGFKLTIAPTKIINPEEAYEKISSVVAINREDFFSRATKINDPYEEIAYRLTKEEADAVTLLKIPGVSIRKEKWRFYPGENLASHTLGLVGYLGDELAGRYGLERKYNKELSRTQNKLFKNFFAEVFADINRIIFSSEAREGDVITSIDPAVQIFLEKTLEIVMKKYNADSIGGIIMDPSNGSIYALAAKPDFNPNSFSKVKESAVFTNPLVENVLEFGSVAKPLVMAAALNEGIITPDDKYEDKGSVFVEKKEIFNFDGKGRGVVNMQEVLNQSLNTGMVFVYQKLGKEKMRDYLFAYGLKEKSGIDLPNETYGLTSNLNSPREIEFANASFGQGVAFTPVQMVRALSALGNGGALVTPHVVSGVKYPDGTVKKMEYKTIPTKITRATSETITSMLVTVMDKAIKGGLAKLEHHSIAVKTGTAQVADSKNGGYYEDRHTHSFFGYFPAYEPKFIVLLYAVNPKGVLYAAQTWSDPFLDITKFLISYYEVSPDR